MRKFTLLAASVLAIAANAQDVSTSNTLDENQTKVTTTTTTKTTTTPVFESAEENYGRIGVGYDQWSTSIKGYDGTNYNGFYVDWVILGTPLAGDLYVEGGIRFNYELKSEKNDGITTKLDMFTVGIPLNLTYRFEFGNSGVRLSPFAGINFKVHAFGEMKQSWTTTQSYNYIGTQTYKHSETTNLFSKDDMGDAKYKRFQMGWQVGVNLELKKFYITFSYGTDFIKIAEQVNTSNLTLGVGFTY